MGRSAAEAKRLNIRIVFSVPQLFNFKDLFSISLRINAPQFSESK